MKDYYRLVSITEPLAYLEARLSEISVVTAMLDVRGMVIKHIEQLLMGFNVQPESLSSMLSDIGLPSELKNEIVDVTHDMIHGCLYKFNREINGDTVVGLDIIQRDTLVIRVEPTEDIMVLVDQFEASEQYY